MTRAIRVIEPGLMTTVQDPGRPGHSALGVPVSGAADSLSIRLGNRMVGNPPTAAALEMTLTGGTLEFEQDGAVAVVGARADVRVVSGLATAASIRTPAVVPVRARQSLEIGHALAGSRSYICIAGGIDVPRVLGSASTHVAAGFGGHDGRPLRPGDRLMLGDGRRALILPPTSDAAGLQRDLLERRVIRATEGAQHAAFPAEAAERFWSSSFAATSQSDRIGLRLSGTRIDAPSGGRMISEGMPPGAVQVPEGGQPIVLLADHPTTGGYPVIATVITADLPVLGQLRPGDSIRFERVTPHEARELLRALEFRLDRAAPRP